VPKKRADYFRPEMGTGATLAIASTWSCATFSIESVGAQLGVKKEHKNPLKRSLGVVCITGPLRLIAQQLPSAPINSRADNSRCDSNCSARVRTRGPQGNHR
jgi:hypothetical protein